MPAPTDRSSRLPRMLWWTALGFGAVALLVFLFGVSQRLLYPHELEWMEGAMVDHSSRIANGLPLYCAPGPEHVPFLYAPLLFWLGGLSMKAGCDGLLALRLLATAASIGCALLVGHWVRRETGRIVPGLVATGLFFAGYGWLAWWYDLARNDALFLLPCLGAAYVLRHGGQRRWLFAAALATTAFLAKQSALIWLPAIVAGALCHDWRNALRFLAASVAGIVSASLWMHLATDGWSTFWLLEMPRHHAWNDSMWLGFWTWSVRPMLPLVALGLLGFVAAWSAGRQKDALFLAAFGSGGLVTSWFSILHVGGYDNVMMYAFAGACVLGPTAAAMPGLWLPVLGPLLLLVQFGLLGHAAWQRDPLHTLLPSPAHRRAHDELLVFVRAQPGPVWIPAHGGIGLRANRGTGAHAQAIFDLLQMLPKQADGVMLDLMALVDRGKLAHLSPRAQSAIASLMDGARDALRERRFAAVVVDEVGGIGTFPVVFYAGFLGADGSPDTADDPYVRAPGELLREPAAIKPLLGKEVHSPYALVPRR